MRRGDAVAFHVLSGGGLYFSVVRDFGSGSRLSARQSRLFHCACLWIAVEIDSSNLETRPAREYLFDKREQQVRPQ